VSRIDKIEIFVSVSIAIIYYFSAKTSAPRIWLVADSRRLISCLCMSMS